MTHAKAKQLNPLTDEQVALIEGVDFTNYPIDFSRYVDGVTEEEILEREADFDNRDTKLSKDKTSYSASGKKVTYELWGSESRGVTYDNLSEVVEEQTGLKHGSDFLVYTFAVNTLYESSRTRLVIRCNS